MQQLAQLWLEAAALMLLPVSILCQRYPKDTPMKHRFLLVVSLLVLCAMGLPTSTPLLVHGSSVGQAAPSHAVYLPLIQTENHIIIPPTTKVIDDTTLQNLTTVSSDLTTFTFAQSTPQLAALRPGDVIVAVPSTVAPNGFLRKVAMVSQQQGHIVVQTSNASLEEAITEGSLSISADLLPSQVQGMQLAQGVRIAPQPADIKKDFQLMIAHAILYDGDNNLDTTNDQIVADGSVNLEMAYDIDLSIQNNTLKTFTIKQRATQTTQLAVSSTIAAYSGQAEKELARFPFTPITVFVGAVPLVFQPELTITIGVSGDLKLQVITSVTQQASSTAGLRYQNSSWSPLQDSRQSFQYTPPTLIATLNAEASTSANLNVMLYGIAGPYVHLKAYLLLTADLMKTPWWQLFAGLNADAGARLTVLSKTLASYERNLFDIRTLLAQADATATPTPTPSPTPGPTTARTTRASVASDGSQANSDSYAPKISKDGHFVAFSSVATNLVANDTNNVMDVFVHDQRTGNTTRVSVANDGSQANAESSYVDISDDGRYIVFQSLANNLVTNHTNDKTDVFVYDRQLMVTMQASLTNDGTQPNGASFWPRISGDGRYVTFMSAATNLVMNDTNGYDDIFVHDLQTGDTTRVSITSDGLQANNESYDASISGNGRFVIFSSLADNLVAGDTNKLADIFVHDRLTRVTTRVSIANDHSQTNDISLYPDISGDGRFVTFLSYASNLVAGDTNGKGNIFVYDRENGLIQRVSLALGGGQTNCGSTDSHLSDDGRYVAFWSCASNIVASDTNGKADIFVYDRQLGNTFRVSLASDGSQTNDETYALDISAGGRYTTFHSAASNLVANDSNNSRDIFVYDRGSTP